MSTRFVPVNNTPWMEQAVCRETDPEAFFPEQSVVLPKQVKAVCAGCPVRMECLAHAINNEEKYGIWGGLSYKDRSLVRRAWGRAGGTEQALARIMAKWDRRTAREAEARIGTKKQWSGAA